MASINFTFQPGTSLEQVIGFETAGRIWRHFLGDDIEINVHVSMAQDLPETVIGGAVPTYVDTTVAAVQTALAQDMTSQEDTIAASNLNVQISDEGVLEYSGLVGDSAYQASQMTLTQANAKALGIATPNVSDMDGYIVLNSFENSNYSWNYDFAREASSADKSLDFLSVALHELGHILGFTSGVDGMRETPSALGQTTLLDLYRYSDRSLEKKAQELTVGESAYFSIDGGKTSLAAFSEGIVSVSGGIEGYQASHWKDSSASDDTQTEGRPSQKAFFVTDFLEDLFRVASPADGEPRVDDINGLLANPNIRVGNSGLGSFSLGGVSIPFATGSGTLSISQLFMGMVAQTGTTIRLDETGTGDSDIGVMDPTLAPGQRSVISALDVLAMDVLGYDRTGASTDVNYGALLLEAKDAIAKKLGVSVNSLNANTKIGAVTQDLREEVLDAILYERRRSKRSKNKGARWLEQGLDPNILNIVSDGAGDKANIIANVDSAMITTVEALLPYNALVLRTTDLVGNDDNDLIIPAYDEYQAIAAGNGDNVVQLGLAGGMVTAGAGNDIILSLGGKAIIDAGDGDNVVILNATADARVTTGDGNDQIKVNTSEGVSRITTGEGSDLVILGDQTQAYNTANATDVYAYITDFSATDRLQLHGAIADYRLTTSELLYKENVIAKFDGGVNFTLTGNQVSFVGEATPKLVGAFPLFNPDGQGFFGPSGEEAEDPLLHYIQTYYTLAYSIVGGDDAEFFTIDPKTGDLRWQSIPDRATPLDANGDNKYDVIVQATLGSGNTERDIDTQRLTIINGESHTADSSFSTSVATGDQQVNRSTKGDELQAKTTSTTSSSSGSSLGTASISGQVRNDGDGDGALNDIDGGIAGVTIELFEASDPGSQQHGKAIAKTQTDVNGYYSFENLTDGTYMVKEVDPSGFISTAAVNSSTPSEMARLTISENKSISGQDFLNTLSMGPWLMDYTRNPISSWSVVGTSFMGPRLENYA